MPVSVRNRSLAVIATSALTAALASAVFPAVADAATARTVSAYGANTYGSYANLAAGVTSGPTAAQPMCTTLTPFSRANNTAAVHLPSGLGIVGATVNRVATGRSATTRTSAASSYTAATKLLPGDLLQASAISSIARVQQVGASFVPSGSSKLVGLTLAGTPLSVSGQPNQRIPLAGLSGITLTVNHQYRLLIGGTHVYTTDALVLSMSSSNSLGLPAGYVIVGHSQASLHELAFRNPYGAAWVTNANLGSTVTSGRTSPVYVPCGGTDSTIRRNSVATLNLPGLLSSGAASSAAHSYDGPGSSTANTEAHVASVNVLGGKVQVSALTTKAAVTRTATGLSRSAAGTSIVGLKINGVAQAAPRLNSTRSVPGLGSLSFGRVVNTGTGVQVYGLQIVLSVAVGSQRAGTTINVAVAQAGVASH